MIDEAEHIGAQARTLGWKRQLNEKKSSIPETTRSRALLLPGWIIAVTVIINRTS